MKILKYFKEIEYVRFYILSVLLAMSLFYAVYAFLDADTVLLLTAEDNLYEWLTVWFFAGSSIISVILFVQNRNVFFLVFCLAFFFAAGEEISWGQRIFGFETPEGLKEKNIQHEFTVHNLYVFSRFDESREIKSGITRLLEFNFLFKLGTIAYGVLLPFLVFHFRTFRNIINKIKLPVPPISVGIFFLFNWVLYRFIHTSFPVAAARAGEIFESVAALIFLVIFLFYFEYREKINYIGDDIKNSFRFYRDLKEVPVVWKEINRR